MEPTPTSPGNPAGSAVSAETVSVNGAEIVISGVVIRDEAVAKYLETFGPERRPEELARALSLGVHGLVATSMRATVDDVKLEVRRILQSAAEAAESHIGNAVDIGRSELSAQLDPDVRTSVTARAIEELAELHATTMSRLDPDRTDSIAGRLVAELTAMLGPDGLLVQRLENAFDTAEADQGFGRLLDILERRFQELRDVVVGDQHRRAEAEKGTAKGIEFEDQIEDLLRSHALPIGGCVVDRTGHLGGALGTQCKVGDFTFTLPNGTTIAVEVKNSAKIALAGATGILDELDQAMSNRRADWALCISRSDAFPREVGPFAVYGNRILVVEDGDGTLTGVALRWIAAAARTSDPDLAGVDTGAALDGLQRIRDLAQHFSRSKKVLGAAQSSLGSVRDDLDSLRGQLLDLVDDAARSLRPPATQRVA